MKKLNNYIFIAVSIPFFLLTVFFTAGNASAAPVATPPIQQGPTPPGSGSPNQPVFPINEKNKNNHHDHK